MPTKQQDEQHTARESQERRHLDAVIGKQVMHGLGRPADLRRVEVRPLWEDHYRVNVLVGVDAVSVRIAHSYFLVTDGDGNVIACTPRMSRQY